MNKLQESLIASLKTNACNISDAIKKNNCSLEDFYSYLTLPDFKAGFDEAKQLADDFARTQFMKLIQKGERTAIIEYQKMLRQSDDANEYKRIRRDVMRILINSQDTKTACLKEYCQVFKTTKSCAEDQFSNVIAELGLQTPHQRMKEKAKNKENSMADRFNGGNLTEGELLHCMITQSMHDAENSEYPSERSKARQDIRNFTQDARDLEERKRRESEKDKTRLPKLLKAFVMQTNNKGIDKLDGDMQELKSIGVIDD